MSGRELVLVNLSTPGTLDEPHAAGFERLRAAAKARGIGTGTTNHLQAMRTYEDQVTVWHDNMTLIYALGDKNASHNRVWLGQTWYRRPGGNAAAIPGTSNHGNGDTVDWQNLGGYTSPVWRAFAPLAAEHGWSNVEGASVQEPWHWRRFETQDQHRNDGTPTPTPPNPNPIILEDEVPNIITSDPRKTSVMWLLSADLTTKRHLHSWSEVTTLKAASGAVQVLDGTITADTIDQAAWNECHPVLLP